MATAIKHGPNRPPLTLIGEDGNAFHVMGLARRAAVKAGWSKAQVYALLADMRSSDYDHLLGVAMVNFEVD